MISIQDAFSLERDKVSAAKHVYRLETITQRGPLFDRAYALLDSFFGPKGELESKETLGAMVEQRNIWFLEGALFARYHLVVAWFGDELVGVRDCYTELDPARRLGLVALSHSLIAPAHHGLLAGAENARDFWGAPGETIAIFKTFLVEFGGDVSTKHTLR